MPIVKKRQIRYNRVSCTHKISVLSAQEGVCAMRKMFFCVFGAMLLCLAASCKESGQELVIGQDMISGEETVQENLESPSQTSDSLEAESGPGKVETQQAGADEENGTQEEEQIWVDVCGAVNSPGVYRLLKGARVFEAIQAAGGLSEAADSQWLNQAAEVGDGEKIQVYTKEETSQMKDQGIRQPAQTQESQSAGEEAAKKVNLNTADSQELQTLPGIGETRAEAIIAYREETGGFGSIEEIQNVSGIKGKTFEKIEDYITVK